jgi:hypothetical protein
MPVFTVKLCNELKPGDHIVHAFKRGVVIELVKGHQDNDVDPNGKFGKRITVRCNMKTPYGYCKDVSLWGYEKAPIIVQNISTTVK